MSPHKYENYSSWGEEGKIMKGLFSLTICIRQINEASIYSGFVGLQFVERPSIPSKLWGYILQK